MEKPSIHDMVNYVHNTINRIPGCTLGGSVFQTEFGEVPKLTIDVFITGNDFPNSIVSETDFGVNVKKIIFNPPATIVFWSDNTKTVVKTMEGMEFNPYYGFCAAVTKKVFGNNNRIKNCIKRNGNDHVSALQTAILCECRRFTTCEDCKLHQHVVTDTSRHSCINVPMDDLLEHYRIMFDKEWKGASKQ